MREAMKYALYCRVQELARLSKTNTSLITRLSDELV